MSGGNQQDELAWEARVMQFRDYHRQWRQRGVLPMIHQILADFSVPGRLLAVPEGERRLTDLLHLGELLQQASNELDGEHALLRHLREAIARPQEQGEAHRLRLESDADLVQVVTIHKSKGLEYPLVFLPSSPPPGRPRKPTCRCAGTMTRAGCTSPWRPTRRYASVRSRTAQRGHAQALRRPDPGTARHLARPRPAGRPRALGHRPARRQRPTAAARRLAPRAGSLDDAAHDGSEGATVVVSDAPDVDTTPVPPDDDEAPLAPARRPQRTIREHWWIASYSALRTGATPDNDTEPAASVEAEPSPEPTTAGEATAMEVIDEPTMPAPLR